MEDTRAESLPIGAAEAAAALQTLQRYKAGKAALDKRLIDNELWFRMGHWKNYRDPLMPGKAQPSSGWLFNSIANKHADAMDNYPEPMVLPRAADDQATAQALSSVLPVVLEQADYEQVYSDVWWRKLKQGTGVTGIFWDPAARGGLGDIAVRSVNLLMLYWEPGVQDIQDSPDLFHLSLEDTARLTAQYPQLAGHAAGVVDVPRYIHEDGQTTANKSVVVDWYYKRPDESGRMVLHYCKFCNGVVLYAMEVDGNFYRAEKLQPYHDGENLVFGDGRVIGELEVTDTFDTIPDLPETDELVDSWHQVRIEEDDDRIVFHGRFERGSLVMLLLKNEKETRGYFINTVAVSYLAMCSGAYLEDDDRVIKLHVSKRGLKGTYEVRVLINDKKYATGVSINCD